MFWTFVARGSLEHARIFFGVVSVDEVPPGDPDEFRLMNGRITHGRQFADPAKAAQPTTYYGEKSGVGLAIRRLQTERPPRAIRIGAIGLGIGTLAAYARPGDVIRFYEINPEVERLARRYFTYLSKCRGRCEVVLGDARLSLESEPAQKFDLLAVDAFCGDSIPVHLMTREALAVYRRHMAPGGIIAFHVSNNYLRLAPVVRRLADDCGMHAVLIGDEEDEERLVHPSTWVLVAESGEFLRSNFTTAEKWTPQDSHGPLWTDQYSNLFQILEWR